MLRGSFSGRNRLPSVGSDSVTYADSGRVHRDREITILPPMAEFRDDHSRSDLVHWLKLAVESFFMLVSIALALFALYLFYLALSVAHVLQ